MDLTRKQALLNLDRAHHYFRQILNRLSINQITQDKACGNWTTREVIAHLAGWNKEYLDEIDRVLVGKATWNKFYSTENGDNKFNKKQILKKSIQVFSDNFF